MPSSVKSALKWPQFSRKTDRRVLEVLHSGRVNYWTGDEGRRFESAFADYLGVREAVSVATGTAALQLALEALGIGPGDDVIVSPYSFRASATCAVNAGANMVFADVGPDHMLNAETIRAVLTPRTKAVVVVHLYGQVADLGPILRLARERGLLVIEDCAQCLGGEYRGKKAGTLGDAGCFSFCQSKHITAGGEGGMVVCRSSRVANRVRSLRDHGWKVGSAPKEYDLIGYNSRLTEIQSVIALGELERFENWNLPRRRRFADELMKGLKGSPVLAAVPTDSIKRRASFWLMPFVLDPRRLKCSVSEFIVRLQAEGALAYRILWPLMADLPVARALIANTVGFWVHPTYSLCDIRHTVAIFHRVAERYFKA